MARTKRMLEILETTYRRDMDFPSYDKRVEFAEGICKLARINKKLDRINENEANGWPRPVVEHRDGKIFRYDVEDEKWREKDLKAEERLQNQAYELAKELNVSIRIQGDPRGSAIKLSLNPNEDKDVMDYIGRDTNLIV